MNVPFLSLGCDSSSIDSVSEVAMCFSTQIVHTINAVWYKKNYRGINNIVITINRGASVKRLNSDIFFVYEHLCQHTKILRLVQF